MARELYMAYQAASHFVAMDEDSAGHVIQSISDPEGKVVQEGEVLATLPKGIDVVVGRVKGLDIDVCAAIDPKQRAVTVVGFHVDAGDRDALTVRALRLMRQSLAVRPVVQVFAEDTAAAMQESVREMLDQFQAVLAVHQVTLDAAKVGRVTAWKTATRLFGHAKRWNTTEARAQFRDVLELARAEPQVVERDGRELLIIDRELLERFEAPLSGAELVDRLSRTPLSPLVFQPDVKREEPPTLRAFGRS